MRPYRRVIYNCLGIVFALFFSLSDALADHVANDYSTNETLTRAYWIQLALKNNPSLKAAYHHWKAQSALIKGSDDLPDPMISFDYFIDEIQTRTGPQEYRIIVSQRLPWIGKRKVTKEIESLKSKLALAKFETLRLETIRRVSTLWSKGIDLENQLLIAQEELELLKQIERIALIRYRLAKTQHPDLILIQLQKGKLENQLGSLRRQKSDLQASLSNLSNQPVRRDFSWPRHYSVTKAPKDTTDLMKEMKRNNYRILAARITKAIAEKNQISADLKAKPDLTLKYGRIFTDDAVNSSIDGSGDDPQFIGVSFNIPLWRNRNESLSAAAHEDRLSHQYHETRLINRLTRDLEQMLHQYHDTTAQINRFNSSLIPQAETALTSLLKSYQTGSSRFTDLIDSEKLLLDLKRMKSSLHKMQQIAIYRIEELTAASYQKGENQ